MKKYLCFLLILFLQFQFIFAQNQQSLPVYHWAYQTIDELTIRGYFQNLFLLNKPYTRAQIANELNKIIHQIKNKEKIPDQTDQWRLTRLLQEFKNDLPESTKVNLEFELTGWQDLGVKSDEQLAKGVWWGKGVFSPTSNSALVTSIHLNQYLMDDPLYLGKEWRGFQVFTEQAYSRIQLGKWHLMIGRDFQKWGSGKDASLLISSASQPMDQISAQFTQGRFNFNSLFATLDLMPVPNAKKLGYATGQKANRYLVAHRLNIKFGTRLQVGISEAAIFSGPDAPVELRFFNPFLPLYGEVVNSAGSSANMLGSIDWRYFPFKNFEFYGEFLIDDIQVEKTGPGDLEPNEIGTILGLSWAAPFSMNALTVGLEYTAITNRTYNTVASWEKFIHRNKPIGHFLGNDFDRLRLTTNCWLTRSVQININYERQRTGEGGINKPFDSPWENYTVEQGYSEPFPTGVVETSQLFDFIINYRPHPGWFIGMEAGYESIQNFQNLKGEAKDNYKILLKFWVDLRKGIEI
ncbi:hypothetical protein JW964_10680 [candidate division KSB1 bacterium]|nr:hypothetical protein [candidate division KSB1 bacterium]